MKKEYIIGGLALLGAIGVVAYLLKPKAPRRNSDGFFGANGRMSMSKGTGGCRVCEGASSNYFAVYGQCRRGDNCKQTVKEFTQG
jgi:hypothetical protein